MRKSLLLLLASCVFVASSCSPSATADRRSEDEAAIQTADAQWSATAAKLDVAATVAFYGDNAVLLPPNAPIAKDAKSIREAWAAMLVPGTAISWRPTKVEAAKSGDLGYLYGTYSLAMNDPKGGPAMNDTGKMVEVWKKQSDGKWKCVVDTFNSDLPAPGPEAKK